MKKSEIRVGGIYVAKVSGKLTKVKVLSIREGCGIKGNQTHFDVINLATGRKTTFPSAAKFRSEARPDKPGTTLDELRARRNSEGSQGSDPTKTGTETSARTVGIQLEIDDAPSVAGSKETSRPFAEPAHTPKLNPSGGSRGSRQPSSNSTASTLPAPLNPASSPAVAAAKPVEPQEGYPPSRLAQLLTQEESPSTSDNAPHVIVKARAGTGKTTTLVEGLRLLRGEPSKLIPSPQQKAVWDAICLSRGHAKTVCFVAFNKSIATELQQRVPKGCDAMTMHSLGFKAVNKAFANGRRLEVTQFRVQDLIAEVLGEDSRELRRTKPVVLKATADLVSLCKMNLVGSEAVAKEYGESARTVTIEDEDLARLASYYEVDLNGSQREVFALVPRILELCKDPTRDGRIDYDDMIWLPVALGLPVFKYDLLLVDEAQDLNRCQQALAKRAGKRLILCGDPKQAIYGFAGADATSMHRMEDELSGGPCFSCGKKPWEAGLGPVFKNGVYTCDCGSPLPGNGCQVLPLTVTRRCGRAIVKEAQRIVPDFEAFETNPEGTVSEALYPTYKVNGTTTERPWEKTYMALAQPGDFVVCRVNAPLVGNCFRFLKRGIKATIQGRDVGQGLISTVKKLSKPFGIERAGVSGLTQALEDWLLKEQQKEQAKRNPNEAKIIALQDRVDCLFCFMEGVEVRVVPSSPTSTTFSLETLAADGTTLRIATYATKAIAEEAKGKAEIEVLIMKIEAVFTDDKKAPGIRLSSIHKAKGLESRRVFFLQPEGAGCPHPMARSEWQREQEMNLRYVAITRAIEELVHVY